MARPIPPHPSPAPPPPQGSGSSWVDVLFNTALNGLPGLSSVDVWVEDLKRRHHGDTESAILSAIRSTEWRSASTGFLSGLGGLVTLPLTLPLDLSATWVLQIRMLAAIARLRGHSLASVRTRSLILACLFGHSLKEAAKSVGMRSGQRALEKALEGALERGVTTAVETGVTRSVGAGLLARWGLKALPVVGGVFSGGLDWMSTKAVARMALKVFAGPPALPEGLPPPPPTFQ